MVDKFFFILFCCLPMIALLVLPHLPVDPFNGGRILQVFVVCGCFVWMAFRSQAFVLPRYSVYVQTLFAVLMLLLALGAILAKCVSLAVLGSLEVFVLALAVVALAGNGLDFQWCLRLFVLANAIALGIYEFSVLVAYVAGLVSDTSIRHDVLIYGVTNFRFFNQYQVWVTPILFFAGALIRWSSGRLPSRLIWLVVCLSWALLFYSSARGAILSLAAVSAIFLWLGGLEVRRVVLRYLLCASVGFVTFYIMHSMLPSFFFDGSVASVVRSGDSGRLALWGYAVDLWMLNPWLGVGSANFATLDTPWLSAHPHNFLFQALSEWGWVAAFIVILLLARYVHWTISALGVSVNSKDASLLGMRVGVLASGLGAAFYSMLDGIHLMPLSQMTGIVVLAMLMKMSNQKPRSGVCGHPEMPLKVVALLALVVWPLVVADSYSRLSDAIESVAPRFWVSGFLVEIYCK